MPRRFNLLYFACGAAPGACIAVLLLAFGVPGLGRSPAVSADDRIELVNSADANDANQPPGTHKKHTAVFDDIWDDSEWNGAEYDSLREWVSKVRLGVTDSVWVDEVGTCVFSEDKPPELFVVVPGDWPKDWALTLELNGLLAPHDGFGGVVPGSQKLLRLYITIDSTGKPVAEMGPLGIVKGMKFSWILDIDLRAEKLVRYPERRPKRPA